MKDKFEIVIERIPEKGTFKKWIFIQAKILNKTDKVYYAPIISPISYCVSGVLKDEDGTVIEGRSNIANKFVESSYSLQKIEPGDSFAWGGLTYKDDISSADGDGYSWFNLSEYRGKKLYYQTTYEARSNYESYGKMPKGQESPKGNIIIGKFTSKVIEFRVPDWDKENILSSLERFIIKDPKAYETILKYGLESKRKETLENVLQGLVYIGRSDCVQKVLPFLKSNDRELKAYAAEVLGKHAGKNVLKDLETALKKEDEEDPWISDHIKDAINSIKKRP